MAGKIVINGKEVNNPWARFFMILGALVFSGLIAFLVISVILPLIGVVVSFSISLVVGILSIIFFGIPFLLVGGAILGVIIAPFYFLYKLVAGDD